MLAQHLEHTAVGSQPLIVGLRLRDPLTRRDFEHRIQPVRYRFVRTKHPEMPLAVVELDDVPKELPQHARVFGVNLAWRRDLHGIVTEVRQTKIPQ